jgi:hypothetical protein
VFLGLGFSVQRSWFLVLGSWLIGIVLVLLLVLVLEGIWGGREKAARFGFCRKEAKKQRSKGRKWVMLG